MNVKTIVALLAVLCQKTMIMPAEGLAIIDRQFAYLDEVAEIR